MAKHVNTLKTMLGFIQAFYGRWFPFLFKTEHLDDIYNYLWIENLYATSGQPSEAQFKLIKDAGYERVINLAPTSLLENSVVEEKSILQNLSIEYIHTPVDFTKPTNDDFETFIANLQTPKKVWVHCAANMRVSAFTYRYRTKVLGQDEEKAMADMQKIWNPIGVWSQFIHHDA